LARAYHNRPNGESYKSVLDKILRAVQQEKVFFPLSATHVIETVKNRDISRRKRLAQVMAEISQGWSMAPESLVLQYELKAIVAETFAKSPPSRPMVFGIGIPYAFGAQLNLHDSSGVIIKMPNDLAHRVNKLLSSPKVVEDFLMGNVESSNSIGVGSYTKIINDIVEGAENFRNIAKPLGQAIHKRAYLANRMVDLQAALTIFLVSHKKTFHDLLCLGQERLMEFFANVPVLNTEAELVIGRDKHWDKAIHRNDPADIAFLSVGIPYCDIVVTEKFWCSLCQRSQLDKKYNTTMLADVRLLEQHLD